MKRNGSWTAVFFVIASSPIAIGLIVASVTFFHQSQTLTCKRIEASLPVTCEYTKSSVFGTEVQQFELLGAKIRDITGDRDADRGFMLVLVTNRGDVDLYKYSVYFDPSPLVDRIRQFIARKEAPPLTWLEAQVDATQFTWQIKPITPQEQQRLYLDAGIFIALGLLSLAFVIVLPAIFRRR